MVFDADRVFAHEICKALDRAFAAERWDGGVHVIDKSGADYLYPADETLSAASVDEITG